jgi:hypothetical protein
MEFQVRGTKQVKEEHSIMEGVSVGKEKKNGTEAIFK